MRKLGIVAIVLAGLYMVGMGLAHISLPISVLTLRANPGVQIGWVFVLSLLPPILLLAVGAFLIGGRNRLAERWFDVSPLDVSLEAKALLRLALIVVGIGMIVRSLQSVLNVTTRSLVQTGRQGSVFSPPAGSMLWDALPETLVGLVQIGLGLLLVGYSQRLAERLWTGRPAEAPRAQTPLPTCPSCGTPYNPADYRTDVESPKCSACGGPLNRGFGPA